MTNSRVGVLALQGAFARHVEALQSCGVDAHEIRQPAQLDGIDGLVIPGGESTTMSKLLDSSGMREPVGELLESGLPVFGTCAGMILLATGVADGRADQSSFAAIDIDVRRNGYGRQLDSFEADLLLDGLGDEPFRAVFIRAPVVERVGDNVDVLASARPVGADHETPVLCRSDSVLVTSFHPELTADVRLHQMFVDEIIKSV